MKRNYKIILALILIGALTAGMQAFAQEKTKEYHESWPESSVQTLEISNKFGEVNVTNKGGSNVTIDVVVTVEAPTERKAGELLDQINVSFGKTGSMVKAETHISRDFKSRQRFSIDYAVNIPSDKNLNIINKYGNTFVNVLNASGIFDIQYGDLTANELNAPANGSMDIKLAYGKSYIENGGDLTVTVQYSTMNFGQLNDVDLNSKYTEINIEKVNSLSAESKYDTFNFDIAGMVDANTKYTQIRIDELIRSMKLDAGFGGIKVGTVDSGFESVSITNSYGQISLGLGDASYRLDASCDYCGISYPESKFTGDRISENQSRSVKGRVGDGSGGTVYVQSRYGQIKLD